MNTLDQIRDFARREHGSGFHGIVAIWINWTEYRLCPSVFAEILVGVEEGRDAAAARINEHWETEGVRAMVLRSTGAIQDPCAEIASAIGKSDEATSGLARMCRSAGRPIPLVVLSNRPFPMDGNSPDFEMEVNGEGVELRMVDSARVLHARVAASKDYGEQLQQQLGMLQYYWRRRWPNDEVAQRRSTQTLYAGLNLPPSTGGMLAGLKGKSRLSAEIESAATKRLQAVCSRPADSAAVRVEGHGGNLVNWVAHSPAESGLRLARKLCEVFGAPSPMRSHASSVSSLLLGDLSKEDRTALRGDGELWVAQQTVQLAISVRRWGNIMAHSDDYIIRIPTPAFVGILQHEVLHAKEVVDCWKL